jgi:hypothetical protein
MLNTIVDNKEALKKLRKLSHSAFPGAVRNSLNNMAKGAGTYSRSKSIPKHFNIRNKWTKGSIVPSKGKNFGLIPKGKNNISKMFSFTGSRQKYLLDQEEGFSKDSPSIPMSKSSRKGGSFSGNVRPSLRMKKITKNIRSYKHYKNKAKSKKGKTFSLLSMSAREGYKGFFFLDVPGTFPRGIYKFKGRRPKKKSSFPRVTRVRSQEKRRITYKSRRWNKDMVDKFQKQSTYDFYWNQQVRKMIDPVFKDT